MSLDVIRSIDPCMGGFNLLSHVVSELTNCKWFLFITEELCFQNVIVKIVCLECNIMYSGVNFPI